MYQSLNHRLRTEHSKPDHSQLCGGPAVYIPYKAPPVQSKRQVHSQRDTNIHPEAKDSLHTFSNINNVHWDTGVKAHLHIQTTHLHLVRLDNSHSPTHTTTRGDVVNLLLVCLKFSQLSGLAALKLLLSSAEEHNPFIYKSKGRKSKLWYLQEENKNPFNEQRPQTITCM